MAIRASHEPGGSGGPGYTIPAEFRSTLFHKRGALGAARMGDDVNPTRASSGSQFYIVEGKRWTDAGLDSTSTFRLKGRKIPPDQRAVYKELGAVLTWISSIRYSGGDQGHGGSGFHRCSKDERATNGPAPYRRKDIENEAYPA